MSRNLKVWLSSTGVFLVRMFVPWTKENVTQQPLPGLLQGDLVKFGKKIIPNYHNRQPIADLWGWDTGCVLWVSVWFIFCLCHRSVVCNITKSPRSGVIIMFSVRYCRIHRVHRCKGFCLSRQNCFCQTLHIWSKEYMGLGKCTGWPFSDLGPRYNATWLYLGAFVFKLSYCN